MFVRLFYSSISLCRFRSLELRVCPSMRLSESADVLLKVWPGSKGARHLGIGGSSDSYRLVIFAWWSHPFPSRTRK